MTEGELVGVSGPSELLPRLNCGCADIASLPALRGSRPPYYVLSADYARAVPLHTDWGELIDALQQETAGYRLITRFRASSPVAVVARRPSRSGRSRARAAQ